jgi:hypothetical protein
MTTQPLEKILYRELSKAEAKEIIDIAAPLLQELVNFGTNALARCLNSQNLSGKIDEDIAVLALYRHIIEITDGLEVLLSQSCSLAAIPLIRSSFEALLAIEYILENDANYTQRSLAWLVGYVHKRLNTYERLDPSTHKGQEAKRLFENDRIMKRFFPLSSIPVIDVKKAQAKLQTVLAKHHLQYIEAEYNKYNKPEWYKLFGGPTDLRKLAELLKHGGQYEILYRQWSTTAHAQDLQPFLDRTDKGEPAMKRMREPDKIKEIASLAASFLLGATRQILNKFHPGEDLASWYKREVKERYQIISGVKNW